MIKLFGDEAAGHAAGLAEFMQDRGDEGACAAWKQILRAINELKSTELTGMPN